jgi:hypothetical protein
LEYEPGARDAGAGADRVQYVPLLPRSAGIFDPPRDASLFEGGVNGRKPSWFAAVAVLAGADECVLLLGGVNGRDAPRLSFCAEDGVLPAVLVPGLFISLPA